ncbi:MAG TPA: nuclear transport factor 2 family protein [Allosphingosinicella sp.]|jgi:ketosteroid isomerase-like protein|nr:nuclear transport factor 2 family protein [Allosphingosinicella sp.]
MKKHLFLAGLACAAAAPLAAASAGEREVARSVASFVEAVNTGHLKEALAHLTPDVAITEDLAPYRWQGPKAGAQWLDAMWKNGQRMGVSNIRMRLEPPMQVLVSGDRAYEAIPGVVTLAGKGPTLHERGLLTFALRRSGGVWKINQFSWGGEKAKP